MPLFVADALSLPVAVVVSIALTAASVGLQILSAYLTPKPPPVHINKTEARIQTSEYGGFIPRVHGTMGGIAGTIIHAFPIPFRETVTVIPGQGGKRKTPDTYQYTYSVNLAILLTSHQISGVTKIIRNDDVWYIGSATGNDVTAYPTDCASLRIHVGKADQAVDSVLEAEYGSDNVPAYRGSSYIVIENLVLTKSYNRIPQFIFTIEADDGSLQDIIIAEAALCGLTEEDFDLTALAGLEIDGLYIGQRSGIGETVLAPIAQRHFIDWIEADGKIVALPREGRTSEVTVPFADMGAYEPDDNGNSEKPARLTSLRRQDQDLPRIVEVVYKDTGRDYEQSSQTYARQIFDSSEREIVQETGVLAMSANAASKVAKIQAVRRWNEREPFEFTLQPKYAKWTNGTIMTIETAQGREATVIVNKMELDVPGGLIKVQANSFLAAAYTQTGEGEVGKDGSGTLGGGYQSVAGPGDYVPAPFDTLMRFSNLDGLRPEFAGLSGFYVWVTIDPADTRPEAQWGGVILYQDAGGVGTLRTVGSQAAPSTFGATVTSGGGWNGTLADGSGVDTVNTVDVEIEYGTLESIEAEDFDTGQPLNLFVIGGEVIQARDVTQPDAINFPQRYRLAHLRRGLRGTVSATASHDDNDDVMLIDATMSFVAISPEYSGDELTYYAAASGQSPYDTTGYPYTYGAPSSGVNFYYTTISGNGVDTSFPIYHGLGSTNVSVTFDDYSNGPSGYPTDANNVQADFSSPPSGSVGVTITRF